MIHAIILVICLLTSSKGMTNKKNSQDTFKFSGQNLYRAGSKPDFPTIESQVAASMTSWYSEIKDATQGDIDKYGYATA